MNTSYYLEKKDQEVLLRCGRESGDAGRFVTDPKVLQAYSAEMQKLAQEGRYQDIQSLQEKYFGQGADAEKRQNADNFGVWKKGLKT